jgi:two-component system, NarL family, nitrate/nitrite response regulator NarL
MMRVILVDDHRTFRESFRIALWHEAAIEVVGEAGMAREVYALAESEKPDLIVADLMLQDTDGVSLARELNRRGVTSRIMLLTMHTNALFVRDAFAEGVLGYALKEQPLADIIAAMKVVATGERYLAPVLGAVPLPRVRNLSAEQAPSAGLDQLSRREREIFGRIIQGLSSRDIAESLCISLKTVETHRSHINRKLGVHSPAELIRLAALKGLLVGAREVSAA